MSVLRFIYTDDEHMDIEVDGNVVAFADHGPHGWDGMEGIRDAVLAVAKATDMLVMEDGERGF